MKTEPTVSSETSVIRTQTPGNYPKRNKLHLQSLFQMNDDNLSPNVKEYNEFYTSSTEQNETVKWVLGFIDTF